MSNNAPYNSAEMHALEAKDFLVQQTAEQVALENAPLSNLEKRTMYFTETDECPEDPIALNEAFTTAALPAVVVQDMWLPRVRTLRCHYGSNAP